jgi:hypothetical protein
MNRILPAMSAAALAAALAVLHFLAAEQAHAVCSVLARHPCTPYFGSVLRRHPFTPYSCSVFGGPCSPETVLIAGNTPVVRVAAHDGPAEPADRSHPLDHLNEVGPLLSRCLELPPGAESQPGMALALRFAFKRNGELVAEPRFTYIRGASEPVKAAWHAAALDMLRRCTPLPVTGRFGDALAGQPLVVAIRDARGFQPGVPAPGTPAESRP